MIAAPTPTAPPGRATIDLEPAAPAGVLSARVADVATIATSAPITTLSDADTRALLARLEPLPAIDNAKAPALRAPSPPPPRPGAVQPIAFVAVQGKVAPDAPAHPGVVARPLAPPQIAPTGEVPAESEVRIRFDEPMIAVASVGAVAHPPAKLEPAVAGTWRWLDTRVLQFTASRLPQATGFASPWRAACAR